MMPRNSTDKADLRASTITHKVTRLSTVIASKLPISGIYDERRIRNLSTLPPPLCRCSPRWRLLWLSQLRRWMLLRTGRWRWASSTLLPPAEVLPPLLGRNPVVCSAVAVEDEPAFEGADAAAQAAKPIFHPPPSSSSEAPQQKSPSHPLSPRCPSRS